MPGSLRKFCEFLAFSPESLVLSSLVLVSLVLSLGGVSIPNLSLLLGLEAFERFMMINLHGRKSNITEPILILDTVRDFLIIDHLPIAHIVVIRLDGATLHHVVSETASKRQQCKYCSNP